MRIPRPRLRRPLALAIVLAQLVLIACNLSAAEAGFRRGATLVEFFQFPAMTGEGAAKTYDDPAYPQSKTSFALFDFDALRRIGFDHMRIPLDLGPLMTGSEQQRRTIVDQLIVTIAEINRHGLSVLVTVMPPSLHRELPETYLDGLDGPKFRTYAALIERIADAMKSIGPGLAALEPMNEPQSVCRVRLGTDWTEYQQVLVDRIRHVAPGLPVFLTGGCWSNIEGIVLLTTDLLRDPRNFVSVHFYYPFPFTHQGAEWAWPHLAGTLGIPYPASAGSLEETLALTRRRFKTVALPADTNRLVARMKAEWEIRRYFLQRQGRSQISDWMKQVADWQKRQHIDAERVVFTEFGAMKQETNGIEFDPASRRRWLEDTSSEIETHGWGWTAYVLRDGPFGLYARESDRAPDPNILRALRLNPP